MTKIKAPYNFVPLSDKVVYPKWVKAVNHDVPFADGESGTINIKIETHSPIFVRDGGGKNKQGVADSFFRAKDNYYIPGSSLKGMLRSVVEVMTFSKMQTVNNDRYSVRDFQNKDIYPMLDLAKEVKAAWLEKKDGKYFLTDCGAPGRIPHHWIDNAFGTKYRSFYKKGGGFKGNIEEHKSAKYKYDQFGSRNRNTGFISAKYGKDNSVDVRKFFKVDPYSDKKGTLVFTGQSGPRNEVEGKKPNGKIHEFIFFDTNTQSFKVDEDIIKNFFFAYFDQDKNRQSIDWKYWKPKLNKGEKIPVFFRYEDEHNKKIKDMGLSFLYKIIYENSVLDSVPDDHKTDKHDFAETLFGYIDNKQSLKGRVHISHAKAINEPNVLSAETSVLSGPKASYYPNYIRQSGKNGITNKYKTFMDNTAIIAGWKRYPIHKNGVKSNPGSTDNSKVETSFIPLDKGVEFEFKIRVHNLRKAELGAILSAITFHNSQDTYHSIGMAKPLGYGKAKLKVTSIEGFENDDITKYMSDFESYINYALGYKKPEWHLSEQISELLVMVSEFENKGKSELAYMKMNPKTRENDFIDVKNRKTGGGEFLDKYSKLVESKRVVQSLTSESKIAESYSKEKSLESKFLNADLEKSKKTTLEQSKKEVLGLVDDYISNLLDGLEETSKSVDKLITDIRKEIKKAGVSGGPNIKDIDPKNREAFDLLKKEIEKFVKAKTGINNIKKLVKEHPEGILEKEYSEEVLAKVKQILFSHKEKDQVKKGEVYEKKISEWLGQETAQQWFEELNK